MESTNELTQTARKYLSTMSVGRAFTAQQTGHGS